MANLNLYLNGTPGGTDGTLIDPTTGILDLSGIYPISGDTKCIIFPLCLRCNPGFRATSVRLTTADSNFRFIGQTGIFTFDTYAQLDEVPGWSAYLMNGTVYLGQSTSPVSERAYVEDKNILFLGAYSFYGAPTAGTRSMFSISYVENQV